MHVSTAGHALRDLHRGAEAADAYRAAYELARRGAREAASNTTRSLENPIAEEDCDGLGPDAIQNKLLEFSAQLAAGNHCRLPISCARACLEAAADLPLAEAGGGHDVVTANMYDVLQLDPSGMVIKRLAKARGDALQSATVRGLARSALWRPSAPPPPVRAWRPPVLVVAMMSASFDGGTEGLLSPCMFSLVHFLFLPPPAGAVEGHPSVAPRTREKLAPKPLAYYGDRLPTASSPTDNIM